VVKGPREIVRLADAFNSMTAQLRDLIDSLERRVAERTHRLRLVATISEQFNAILDFEQLLLELVHQVRENFYYHQTAIYLVSEDRQTLVLKASAREFGYQTKPDEQTIHVGAPLRLVAQAFRNREIVTASNMREGETWLAASPAEESYVEMAVPFIVAGVVVGILDVQQNERDGLDEGDANLLRSLANQVSVALTNARLFTETMQAKDEAEEAREATEKVNQRLEERIWQTSGQAELSDQIRGEQDLTSLADSVIQHLCRYLGAQIGALYVVEDERLLLVGKFAYSLDQPGESFQLGEGLIGQAAVERQPLIIQDVPENYIRVRSGIGETPPKQIMIFPFIYEDRLLGVIELGRLTLFSRAEAEFVRTALKSIAITFNTVRIRLQIQQLLEETQRQAEELQLQGVELQTANEGLEAQTASLRLSETRLMEKQSELEATNTELEEKARALEESSQALHEQRSLLDQQNQELSLAQQDLLQQTQALALANQYKSEFLSNMSHELRTPLNSLLILSRVLAENENGNLTAEQLEFVNIIYGAGSDLLTLINDILDLAKVESGQLLVNFDAVALTDLVSSMMSQFNHIATEKGLDFRVSLAEELPQIIETDEQRLKQIIRNLLSNAFKFTHAGEVTFHITRPTDPFILQWLELEAAAAIAFQVRDTGIGISAEQQKIIFEAFKQADSGMSRQYGGTGLGLTISRELAARLGGQIELDSELGRGSTFTLYLPAKKKEAAADGLEDRDETAATAFEVDEAVFETESLPEYSSVGGIPFKGDGVFVGKKVLVADDDVRNAFALSKILADKGIDVRVAGNGQKALEMLAAEPVDLVLMDIMMPIMDGYEATRRIRLQAQWQALPILALTAKAMKGDREKCLEAGANDYLSKPIDVDQLYAMLQNWLYR
jgi:two-component system chemotaxis sensor kinase CheA